MKRLNVYVSAESGSSVHTGLKLPLTGGGQSTVTVPPERQYMPSGVRDIKSSSMR